MEVRSVAATALAVSALGLLVAAPSPARAQSASAGNVNLNMTVPEGVTKFKAAMLFTARGLASGWAKGAPMAALAKRIQAPIIIVGGGDDLNDNSYPGRCASGEFNGVPMALAKLAAASNHPELEHAPLITVGHSHGGDYWNWFTACHPDRIAVVFVHASGGVNYSKGALEVPVIYELGTGDLIENGSKKPRAGMFNNRARGAPMSLVIGQGEGHDQVGAGSLQMIIDIVEGFFKLRVPADADISKGPIRLTKINESSLWIGDLYSKEVFKAPDYKGSKVRSAVLPSEEIAMKWKTTSVAMPMNVVIPEDKCTWCKDPRDEPEAKPGGEPTNGPPSPPSADAGASADTGAGSSTGGSSGSSTGTGGSSGSSNTGGASTSSGGSSGGTSNTGGSPTSKGGSSGGSSTGGSSGSPSTGGDETPASSPFGCSFGGHSRPGVAGLALALLALTRRRRRQ
jgi:uncharacterized membrane protein YgcG